MTQVKLSWTAPSGLDDGGDDVAIDTYEIYYKGDTVTTYTLAGSVAHPTTTFEFDTDSGSNEIGVDYGTGLTTNTIYYFKIVAINKYGPSPIATSGELAYTAATAPDTPNAPVVSMAAGSSYIKIEWDAPASDGSEEIDAYEIQIKNVGASTWHTVTAICDGS